VGIRKDGSSMKIMAGSAALGGMRSVSYLPFWRTKLEVCARLQHMHNPSKSADRHYGKAPAGFSADAVRSSPTAHR